MKNYRDLMINTETLFYLREIDKNLSDVGIANLLCMIVECDGIDCKSCMFPFKSSEKISEMRASWVVENKIIPFLKNNQELVDEILSES